MDKLIPLIKELSQILSKASLAQEIKLPTIAVIGSQSSGKSSLLEAIVGKQFLPKGKGIVTRRPIQIHLSKSEEEEYVQIERSGEKYKDFSQIPRLIDSETDKLCGTSKGIREVPLTLRISAKNVIDLILVDLPGIAKNPVGDQPADIEQVLIGLCKKYIASPNVLILAVSKATEDIANSESLKLAYEVDPKGQRTLGVITFMDLVEEGSDVLRDVANLSRPINLGVVGVTCPNKCKPGEEQLKFQRQFFQNHSIYKQYAEKMGISYLQKTLNSQFISHIKRFLPEVREQVVLQLHHKETLRRQLGEYEAVTDRKVQGLVVLNLISKFVTVFNDMLDGRSLQASEELVGGARIQYIFSFVFRKSIDEMNPFEFLSDEEIRIAIRNANGISKSLFIPEVAFETLLRQQIARLEQPALDCARLIHEELRRILAMISLAELERFQNLHQLISEEMEKLLRESLIKTESMISNLIEIELGYINTMHPDFKDAMSIIQQNRDNLVSEKDGDSEAKHKQTPREKKSMLISQIFPQATADKYDLKLKNIPQKEDSGTEEDDRRRAELTGLTMGRLYVSKLPKYELPPVPSRISMSGKLKRRDHTEVQLIKHLIFSYFSVVKKNINDSVPKSIVTFLINSVRNNGKNVLVNSLYKEDSLANLLHENEYNVTIREQTKKECVVLRSCLNSLARIEGRFN